MAITGSPGVEERKGRVSSWRGTNSGASADREEALGENTFAFGGRDERVDCSVASLLCLRIVDSSTAISTPRGYRRPGTKISAHAPAFELLLNMLTSASHM